MSDADIATKKYMSDNARFADVFNYYLFDGRQNIQPETLVESDTTELFAVTKENSLSTKERKRDLKKYWIVKEDAWLTYALLALENQTNVHYALPVRNNLEDAMSYVTQVEKISKKHREDKDLKGDEFLSGFSKTDKIKPVITLVIYFGAGVWDGPRSLYEMLDTTDENILKYVNDYKMNLIVPSEMKDTEKFQTDFRYVMDFIKASDEKQKTIELLQTKPKAYELLDNDAVMVLNTCVNAKIKVDERRGETNMCKAIDDMIADAVEEAVEKEHNKMLKMAENMIFSLYHKNILSEETAANVLKLSVDEFKMKIKEAGQRIETA